MAETKTKKSGGLLSLIGIILCIIFGAMLILNVTIIAKGVLQPNTPPSVVGYTPMVVQSGSMSGNAKDHIEIGDLIFIKKTDVNTIQKGDVISYMDGNIVVTHRVMAISKDENGVLRFEMKGDANSSPDPTPVAADKVIGRYVYRVAKVGDFALFLQTPLGMAIFIGIPICLFILIDILRHRRRNKIEDKRTAELEAEIARLKAMKDE